MPPENRAHIDIGYINLADPDTVEKFTYIVPGKGGVLSSDGKTLPVETLYAMAGLLCDSLTIMSGRNLLGKYKEKYWRRGFSSCSSRDLPLVL